MKAAENKEKKQEPMDESEAHIPDILEEIEIEDLTVDGICGVY